MDVIAPAIPGFFATMGLEHALLRRRAARTGEGGDGATAGDDGRPAPLGYERRDTLASLAMGVGSLVVPLAMSRLLAPVTPGRGRHGRALVGVAVGAAALTTAADVVARGEGDGRLARWARRVQPGAGVTAVASGVVAASTAWATRTAAGRLWRAGGHRRDLGAGVAATVGAVFVWDAIYYWNHRLQHESRWLWAIHVVHHSSERYNLSTALRQPVAETFGMFVPYGLMAFLGFRPGVIETARGVNLLYQYWIHTEAIDRLGPLEEVLNTPSHHRVHHGSNRRYLDRNHGSILIVWDRLFGTFQREDPDEPPVYGLTTNIDTYHPLRIATHEHAAILRDVARSTTWRERLGRVLRGPGWRPDGRGGPDHPPRPSFTTAA